MADLAAEDSPDELIRTARTGGEPAFGRLLSRYGNYLTLLARVEVGRRLQGKLDPADLVQDTYLEAHRHFPGFRGTTEPEFASWLRQILAGVLANTIRRYFGTKARDPRLEQELQAGMDQSSCLLVGQLAAPGSSPSEAASRREQAVLFADALGRLPDDHREVLILRNLEGLTFPVVAQRMGRSVDRVERLWMRAVVRLRQVMGGE
ncbi:sigma-70 family RNA polymerase sigma factor [Fimbriiglobus ruber]|uniref:RNA polymerase sigma factor RpoE n=1 Tax=Fimbriiglobus ruber TaxID=1908690 RepID=A0A225DFL4_9BACT|nr:sigma-70 family RNA polymerase sigma factor [Fimbriiglobus ruber]OWK40361.1 RNA polymerase sigma factor RpoE [Fimbriiglobus ruber]